MVKFISEVSSNHSRDLDRCYEFIERSAEIGCYGVKFQLFKIDKLFTKDVISKRLDIQSRSEWELPLSFLPKLKQRCEEMNIKFGCTPFYIEAVKELEEYVDFYKIASYELLWLDLIRAAAEMKKELILSSGMANLEEIDEAVKISESVSGIKPTVLHCVSNYPAKISQVNLSAIKTIKDRLGCKVGWSDHSVSKEVIITSILRWKSEMIEFHLDLDGKGEEFGAGHCWLPDDIEEVIRFINIADACSGDGIKMPTDEETNERLWRADPDDGLRPLKEIRDETK